MIWLLLLLAAPADAGKRKKSSPKAPTPPTLPALDAVNPHALPSPTLAGAGAQLALEGLRRETTRFHVAADLTLLGQPTADEVGAIFDQLAADPRWRVTRTGDGRVALRRRGAPLDVAEHGYHIGEACSRVALLEGDATSPGWDGPQVAAAEATAGTIALGTFHADDGLCRARAAALRVDAAVSLEVYEASPTGNIPVIGDTLAMVPALVASARMEADRIRTHGFGLGLPPGEPLSLPPAVVVEHTADGLTWRARVNPGEVGWSWLVIRVDGAIWEADTVAAATIEQPGWSPTAEHTFLVQSTFGAPAPPPGATAELWFQADGEPRMLADGEIAP